ncbi:MAG: hypothetical protein IPP32_11080 [Bacteroidetes bacterium]|nr:hypothetical protein [Bacteroidota bacterium]
MNAFMNEELPMVAVKRKNIQSVMDYCLENEVEFTVKPKTVGVDEWKIEVNITNVKKAIHFGMFLKEIKSEIVGLPYTSPIVKEPKKIEIKDTVKETIKEVKEKAAPAASADSSNIFAFEPENTLAN